MITVKLKTILIIFTMIFLLGVQIASSDEQEYMLSEYTKAKNYYYQGDYEEALTVYNQLIKKYPQFPTQDALAYKPYVLLKLMRYNEALEFAKLRISREPSDLTGYTTKAQALAGLGRDDEAIEAFTEAQEIFRKHPSSDYLINNPYGIIVRIPTNIEEILNEKKSQDNTNYNSDTVTSKSITSTPVTSAKMLETGL